MKNSLAFSLAVLALLAPVTVQAQQSSVACAYMLLRVYHAELDYCRVTLNNERESRYQRMRESMEKFIRANAKGNADAMISGIADNEKRAIAGLKSCQSDDFKLARQAIDNLTDLGSERNLNDNLKVPRNPQSGSCG